MRLGCWWSWVNRAELSVTSRSEWGAGSKAGTGAGAMEVLCRGLSRWPWEEGRNFLALWMGVEALQF